MGNRFYRDRRAVPPSTRGGYTNAVSTLEFSDTGGTDEVHLQLVQVNLVDGVLVKTPVTIVEKPIADTSGFDIEVGGNPATIDSIGLTAGGLVTVFLDTDYPGDAVITVASFIPELTSLGGGPCAGAVLLATLS